MECTFENTLENQANNHTSLSGCRFCMTHKNCSKRTTHMYEAIQKFPLCDQYMLQTQQINKKLYVTTYLHLCLTRHSQQQGQHTLPSMRQMINCTSVITFAQTHNDAVTALLMTPSPKQTKRNMRINLGSKETMLAPPKPRPAAIFVHHNGSGVMHCPGGKYTTFHQLQFFWHRRGHIVSYNDAT
jgi:hypothetical protein